MSWWDSFSDKDIWDRPYMADRKTRWMVINNGVTNVSIRKIFVNGRKVSRVFSANKKTLYWEAPKFKFIGRDKLERYINLDSNEVMYQAVVDIKVSSKLALKYAYSFYKDYKRTAQENRYMTTLDVPYIQGIKLAASTSNEPYILIRKNNNEFKYFNYGGGVKLNVSNINLENQDLTTLRLPISTLTSTPHPMSIKEIKDNKDGKQTIVFYRHPTVSIQSHPKYNLPNNTFEVRVTNPFKTDSDDNVAIMFDCYNKKISNNDSLIPVLRLKMDWA